MEPGIWHLKDGTQVLIRPIRPEDEPLMVAFHRTLSDRSVYFRYFHITRLEQRVRHERLARICTIDPHHEMALVAVHTDDAGRDEIVGVGRLTRVGERPVGEIALLVSDAHQGKGLGSELLRRLLIGAREEGIERLVGDILSQNEPMIGVARRCGFAIRSDPDDPKVLQAELTVADAAPTE